jgi:SAM-dependent methyltransferase
VDRAARERAHFDRLADEMGSVWWGSITPAGRVRLERRGEIAIRRARLEPGSVVLEPGAGNGEFTARLAPSGATIIGIEISERQVQLGNERFAGLPNVKMELGNVDSLQYPDRHFDAVVGNSVLHHFDLDRALPELFRVLKPGGRFFFFEPNILNPQIAIEKRIKPIGRRLQNSPDETAFLRWRLARRLRRAAFQSVSVIPFDFMHPGIRPALIPGFARLDWLLERTPVIREIAGSLQIYATR